MTDGGRSVIIDALKRELIGPDPSGTELDVTLSPVFANRMEALGPWVEKGTGEEIITDRIKPMRRYATGVLFPANSKILASSEPSELELLTVANDGSEESAGLSENRKTFKEDMDDDFDLSPVNERDPQSAALTFVIGDEVTRIEVLVAGGRYERFNVTVGRSTATPKVSSDSTEGIQSEFPSVEVAVDDSLEVAPDDVEQVDSPKFESKSSVVQWYVRRPVTANFESTLAPAASSRESFIAMKFGSTESGGLRLRTNLLVRKSGEDGRRFVTIAVSNESPDSDCNSFGLFQTKFSVRVFDAAGVAAFFGPYPEREDSALLRESDEARSLKLLYRNYQTYAIGHGCSANWTMTKSGCSDVNGGFFPMHEVPSITPEVENLRGELLDVSMRDLMDCGPSGQGLSSMEGLVASYAEWIDERRTVSERLDGQSAITAALHLDACSQALLRMKSGLSLIANDPIARRAFELANEAVLMQQLKVPPITRGISRRKVRNGATELELESASAVDGRGKGSWRPFQIGFLLTSLLSTINVSDDDRERVELIFFPTGGGKTEAYQGLIAFSLFNARLTNSDQAVGAIMRYTLRLLTAQQFTRAASLIACMEVIRSRERLGGNRFSIGIWVGDSLSPLHRPEACKVLKEIRKDSTKGHRFILNRCPLCSTSLGPAEGGKKEERWPGYVICRSRVTMDHETVIFVCPNFDCFFSTEENPIPAFVIDDDIFDQKPSLVIATIDKFAQVAFNKRIRDLFGIDDLGNRRITPPNLIIQDELHLISGPLGSIVGIYEGLFEELCTDRRDGAIHRPKIVCSTATIRNASEQILGLFGRSESSLFPPNGIDISDSFFAKFAVNKETGEYKHGRLYIGAIGTSLRSAQDLQVRVTAALAQAPMGLPEDNRDPWVTNLAFFNRIQDIGTSFTLLQINVKAQLIALWERTGIADHAQRRTLYRRTELTSRIESSELPKVIDKLSTPYGSGHVDVCLASNIIEVGIDIPRLSLMTILGQPKTTAQYIQVSGRVGRRAEDRPGLIVTMYPPRRARDRSHFEKFRSYHQRLYAEVEPTSVTPWATPVLERAIHAVIIGYMRNMCRADIEPYPFPEDDFDKAVSMLRERMLRIEPGQVDDFERIVQRRRDEWESWQRSVWRGDFKEDQLPLMYLAGTYLPDDKRIASWETPGSMRNVDAECRVKISDVYLTRSAHE